MKAFPTFLLVSLSTISFQVCAQHFTSAGVFDVSFIGYRGSMALADYDGDGDEDVLFIDSSDPVQKVKLLRLTNGIFEDVREGSGLPLRGTDAQWLDYDGDGDMDAFVHLHYNTGTIGNVYLNDNGHFTKLENDLPVNLPAANYAWADYDADGDQDVMLHSSGFTRLFRNNDDSFDEVPFSFNGFKEPTLVWVDFDGDNDMDVYLPCVLSGFVPSNGILYENTGTGFQIAVTSFPPVRLGSVQWADFDADGDPDLLLKGASTGNTKVAAVYVNMGSKVFMKLATINITPCDYGTTQWIDYDQDGDLDIFNSGNGAGSGEIYVMDNGVYTKVTSIGFPNMDGYPVALTDYDQDGDYDAIVAGYLARIYRNDANSNPVALNNVPAWGTDLVANPASPTSIRLTFTDRADDEEDWSVEIKKENGPTSTITFVGVANSLLKEYVASSLAADTKYEFRVRSRNANGYSRYSKTVYAFTGSPNFPKTSIVSDFTGFGKFSWADIDSDGDLDLAFSGYKNDIDDPVKTYILKNNAGTFVAQTHNLPDAIVADWQWADFDLDGDPDLLMSGYYLRANSGFTKILVNQGDFVFQESEQYFRGLSSGVARWIDVNSDGKLDFFISGTDFYTQVSSVYTNFNGQFAQALSPNLPFVSGEVVSDDFNGDGMMDFAFAMTSGVTMSINKGGNFSNEVTIAHGFYKSIRSGDLNGDGFSDLIVAGQDVPTKIYWNNAGEFTEDESNSFPNYLVPEIELGDVDNDGDLDLALGGATIWTVEVNKIFLNDGMGVFSDSNIILKPGEIDYLFADYDNDRDLDFIEVGYENNAAGGPLLHASIVKNNSTPANDRPTAPVITHVEQKASGLLVEWTNGSDLSTALTSNIYVKDSNGKNRFNVVANKITGQLMVPSVGNQPRSHEATISHLFLGDIEIGVQNIDNSFIGSPFTTAQYSISALKPELITVDTAACEDGIIELQVAGQNIQWYKTQSMGPTIATGNKKTFKVRKNDTTFYATQRYYIPETMNMIDGPILQVNVKVYHPILEKIEMTDDGLLAPAGTAYQWIRNDSVLVGATNRKITTSLPGRYRIRIHNGPCVSDTIAFLLQPPQPVLHYADYACVTAEQVITAEGKKVDWFNRSNYMLAFDKNSYAMTVSGNADTVIFATQTVNSARSPKAKAKWTNYRFPSPSISIQNEVITASEGMSYQWYLDDEPIQGETSRTISAVADGVYHAEISNGNCTTHSQPFIYTTVEDVNAVSFGYDPATETVHVDCGKRILMEVLIFDVAGKRLQFDDSQLRGTSYAIRIKGASSGLYILNIRMDDNSTYRGKFIKY